MFRSPNSYATIEVNVQALTALAGRFLPGIGSTLARRTPQCRFDIGVPGPAVASGLFRLEGLRGHLERGDLGRLARHRGPLLLPLPGPVDTPYFDNNQIDRPPKWAMQSPEAVARAGLRGDQRNDCHVLPFLPFRLLAWSTRLAPRALAARLGGWYAAPHNR